MDDKPLLTICCISYNHKEFIKQALDSILMQQTNFKFEILVHDDASTDGTVEILREYEIRYPKIVRVVYQSENQFSKNPNISKFIYAIVKSKYVALCDGDDYWTDSEKLQRQVDFLEANPDFAICFHPVDTIYEDSSRRNRIFPKPKQRFNKTVLMLDDLLLNNFIQTNSVVYRWRFVDEKIEDYFPDDILPGDWYIHLLHAELGKIGFIDNVMAVYRKHQNGIWWASGVEATNLHLKYGLKILNFYFNVYQNISKLSEEYKENIFIPHLQYFSNLYLANGRIKELKIIVDRYQSFLQHLTLNNIVKPLKDKNKIIVKKLKICIVIQLVSLVIIGILIALLKLM